MRLERGPTPEEKLAAYNGPILREKIQEHFGKLYSLNWRVRSLASPGLQRPDAPDHANRTPIRRYWSPLKKKSSQRRWKKSPPKPIRKKRILIYYQDEARFGQHGTIMRVWAKVGTRPRAIQQNQYDYLYVFAAVCPQTGDATGADLLLADEHAGDECVFGTVRARELPADVHWVMVLDRGGWHMAGTLWVLVNVTLIHLPPKITGTQSGGKPVALSPQPLLVQILALQNVGGSQRSRHRAAGERVCLVPEKLKTVCADTALRGNQV